MTFEHFADRLEFAAMTHFVRDLEESGRSPVFRVAESATSGRVRVAGSDRIMLGSNNYLGLADHPEVRAAAHAAIDRFGVASTGSRVANGTIELHLELEAEIAAWHGAPAALVFTTGYQANVGTVSALARHGDTVVLDWAAHASLQDGAALSGAAVRRFPHNDVTALREILSGTDTPTMVVVDGLYSMEGDLAPLHEIAALCAEFEALLMVDEAHSTGILGPDRTGAVSLYGVGDGVDVRMGTLSKGIGSIGGYVAGSRDLIDHLRTHARAYQFTTSGNPAATAAALAAVRIVRSDEGAVRAERVLDNAARLRHLLTAADIPMLPSSVLPSGERCPGPIVPVEVGDEAVLLELWNDLFDSGVHCGISVFPGVRVGSPLLRVCVTADHSPDDMETVGAAIARAHHRTHTPVTV
ncbi:aminotransferase class I/II-fold pyridoxal phosphate-dependent enzyme [Nocardia nova]|uniref:aminotransferase class I/II-fold pyridoxal phosphate-dependent enzyme n=1 Tax=Nocardia nova TaxID=37330 RepID=UPI0033F243D7